SQPANVVASLDEPPGTVVFGVAVAQTPTCAATASSSDPYLGLMHVAPSSVTPASFKLVYQTGQVGTRSENSKTATQTRDLPAPRQTTRIDSWGPIVE